MEIVLIFLLRNTCDIWSVCLMPFSADEGTYIVILGTRKQTTLTDQMLAEVYWSVCKIFAQRNV